MVSVVLLVRLRDLREDYAVVLSIVIAVVMLAWLLREVVPVLDQLSDFFESTRLNSEYQEILIKALGISFIAQLGSDSCKDAGESAIASKVEMCAKVVILVISLPLFAEVLGIAASMFTI